MAAPLAEWVNLSEHTMLFDHLLNRMGAKNIISSCLQPGQRYTCCLPSINAGIKSGSA